MNFEYYLHKKTKEEKIIFDKRVEATRKLHIEMYCNRNNRKTLRDYCIEHNISQSE